MQESRHHMDPLIVKFLKEDKDETMHSGADVDAFTAALNRDIEGDTNNNNNNNTATGQAANAVNRLSSKNVPFAKLLPVIELQLDKDRAEQLKGLYNRLKSYNINREEFVRQMRTLVGDFMLKMAVYKLLKEQIPKVENASHPTLLPTMDNAQKSRLLEHHSDTAIKQQKQQQQQHMHFPQSSFPTYGNPGGNYTLGSNPNMNISSQSNVSEKPQDVVIAKKGDTSGSKKPRDSKSVDKAAGKKPMQSKKRRVISSKNSYSAKLEKTPSQPEETPVIQSEKTPVIQSEKAPVTEAVDDLNGVPEDIARKRFKPDFGLIQNLSLYNNRDICRDLTDSLSTPAELARMDKTDNGSLAEQFDHALAQLNVLGPEMRQRWFSKEEECDNLLCLNKTLERKAAQSHERAERLQRCSDEEKRILETQVFKLRAEVEELKVARTSGTAPSSSLNDDAVRASGKMNLQHGRVVTELQAKFDVVNAELHASHCRNEELINRDIERVKRIKELEAENETLREDRSWLITQGPRHITSRVLKSKDFIKAHSNVNVAHYRVGCHDGVIAGYRQHRMGHPVAKSPFHGPQAENALSQTKEAFDQTSFSYLDALASTDGLALEAFQGVEPVVPDPEAEEDEADLP